MTQHEIHSLASHFIALIDEYNAGCDPEFDHGFDPALDDLEREFAEIRMFQAE